MMELVRIFPTKGDGLFSVHFFDQPQDEFRSLFEFWSDPELLEDFFEQNRADLAQDRYQHPSVDDAVFWTIEESKILQNVLYERALQGQEDLHNTLQTLFKPLEPKDSRSLFYQRNKVYSRRHKGWLRIYAIRLNSNTFLVTGGAIKLTQRMEERTHTQSELVKLENVKQFLKRNGIDDCDLSVLKIKQ